MSKAPVDEKKLNEEQKKAVTYGDGPLLIIAGAGTGKTTVVTERIKYFISSGKALPQEVLALTFTEKAAREMEERVDVSMPYGYTQMWISTFHNFCDRLLRQEAIHVGLNPSYRLMSDTDATMFFRRHLFEFELTYFRPLGNPTKFISGMLQHFSRLQDEDISPVQYAAWVRKTYGNVSPKNEEEMLEKRKYTELARTFAQYQDLKVKEGLMDFGDLITRTLGLFRERKNILISYRKRFKYILVDEFQDTNIAQNELVMLLAGDTQNITAVCDDDQSVYKFRGAAVSNVLSFRKHFPKSALIVLSQNYRSTQEILDASYQLIQHNNPDRLEVREQINKKLTAQRKLNGRKPKLIYVDRVENEADEVAKEIVRLVTDSQHKDVTYRWKDVAVLVRANSHAEPFIRAFMRHNVPYQFLGPGQLFKQPEVRDLIAYLSVIHNFEDSVSLFRVLSMSCFALTPRDLEAVAIFSRRQNIPLFEACERMSGVHGADTALIPDISPETKQTLAGIVGMIHRHLALKTKESAGQILYYFLSDTGLIKRLMQYTSPADEKIATNVSKFFSKLKTYETDHADNSVTAVLDWIELSMELGESPLASDTDWSGNDAVNMLSVHGSKGLEFPIVFLVNLVSARFPTTERREQIPLPDDLVKEELPEGDYHLEEERRLFYVGMTRARDILYLTGANYYGEGKREKKLSPFVVEVMGDDTGIAPKSATSAQLSFLDWKPPDSVTGRDVPEESRPVTYLSYSQIETFRLCPLHYKLRYIYQIPSPQSASLSFGSSVHAALRDFYQMHVGGVAVSKKILLDLLDAHWLREGYNSKRYEEDMKLRGREYLTEYFKTEYDPQTKVIALEQPFTIPVTSGGKTIKIGGRIDRIDLLPDGRIEIVDYKTGKMPSTRDVEMNLQLSMYAMAVSEVPMLSSIRDPGDIVLTLYFFDSKTRMSTKRTAERLLEEKASIIETARQIEQSDFRCSGSLFCKDCEYGMFCGVS